MQYTLAVKSSANRSPATAVSRAVLWNNGLIIDLNAVIPAGSNLFLANAFNINDRGEILGLGLPPGVQNGDFGGHDFLLIPCNANDEGCQESAKVAATATPKNEALSPVETRQIVAAWRSRLRHRYRIPGLVAGPAH